jgi:hypothetical protein
MDRPCIPSYVPEYSSDPLGQPQQFGTAQDARRMMDSLTHPQHQPVPQMPSYNNTVVRAPDAARNMKAEDWHQALGGAYGGYDTPRQGACLAILFLPDLTTYRSTRRRHSVPPTSGQPRTLPQRYETFADDVGMSLRPGGELLVTLTSRWVTLRARWVTLRAR